MLKNLAYFQKVMAETIRWIETYRPRVLVLVDYPGFNLRLAKTLFEKKISVKGGGATKVIYYISPQIWAWKGGRRFAMARHLDAMSVIFPFEIKSYADTTLPVDFVGHPFLSPEYAPPVSYDPTGPIMLLPGSRKQAVSKIFPVMLDGFAELLRSEPQRRAVVLYPSVTVETVLMRELARRPVLAKSIELKRTGTTVGAAAVLTSSGTMSLHCALAAIPGLIAYRTNPLTYFFAKRLVKVPFIGIANLLLGEAMYPEFIQDAAKPAVLAAELKACLEDAHRRLRTRDQADRLRQLLSHPTNGTVADWLWRQML